MKSLKKIVALFALLIMGTYNASAQTIDSISASYNVSQQELTLYVEGEIFWTDPKSIVSTEDTIFGDSVMYTIHFLPCQILQTFIGYDTVFTINMSLSPGTKHLKVLSYHDMALDSSCYTNPNPGYIDTAYAELNIPIGLEENRADKLRLFPNPTTGILKIQNEQNLPLKGLQVIDLSGEVVMEVDRPGHNIDLTHLPSGTYLVKLQVDEEFYIRSLIKE